MNAPKARHSCRQHLVPIDWWPGWGLRCGFLRLCEFKHRESCDNLAQSRAMWPRSSRPRIQTCPQLFHTKYYKMSWHCRYPASLSSPAGNWPQPVLVPRRNAKYKPWLQASAPAWNFLSCLAPLGSCSSGLQVSTTSCFRTRPLLSLMSPVSRNLRVRNQMRLLCPHATILTFVNWLMPLTAVGPLVPQC